jgi:hypothetical protein
MDSLRPCANRLCERKVGGSAAYCCAPCADADEGHYEIDTHTGSCDVRWAYRQTMAEDTEKDTI